MTDRFFQYCTSNNTSSTALHCNYSQKYNKSTSFFYQQSCICVIIFNVKLFVNFLIRVEQYGTKTEKFAFMGATVEVYPFFSVFRKGICGFH